VDWCSSGLRIGRFDPGLGGFENHAKDGSEEEDAEIVGVFLEESFHEA